MQNRLHSFVVARLLFSLVAVFLLLFMPLSMLASAGPDSYFYPQTRSPLVNHILSGQLLG